MRRLFPILMLLALLMAPAGRAVAAEQVAMPSHDSGAQAGHCSDMPMSDDTDDGKMAIDCLVACAIMAPPAAPSLPVQAAMRLAERPAVVARFEGLSTGTDPPPPRAA